MYGELYQFLVIHRQLSIPGIGTFQIERQPAEIDFVGKVANPPTYTVALHHGNGSPSKKVSLWLAEVFKLTEKDALAKFNDFAFEVRNKVMAGEPLQWNGIGTLSKGMAGEIRFESALKGLAIGNPVPANKILRENAEHTVRVGEDEKTSTEMLEWLNPGRSKRSPRQIAAIVLAILAVLCMGWWIYNNGFKPGAAGNQQNVDPQKPSSTYRLTS